MSFVRGAMRSRCDGLPAHRRCRFASPWLPRRAHAAALRPSPESPSQCEPRAWRCSGAVRRSHARARVVCVCVCARGVCVRARARESSQPSSDVEDVHGCRSSPLPRPRADHCCFWARTAGRFVWRITCHISCSAFSEAVLLLLEEIQRPPPRALLPSRTARCVPLFGPGRPSCA
jgi:hypothetical protein